MKIKELENEWRKIQVHYSDKELLEIFPEAKEIIPQKIKEYKEERKMLAEIIKRKLIVIKDKTKDDFSYWFWEKWIKVNEGEELLKIDKNITRLKRFSSVVKGRVLKGWLTEEQIQQALVVPIESLLNQPLKRSGKALVGLCTFHQEKRPSFFIYPETNSFYCYGCKKGGNVITFVRLFYGYSFSEAVRWLLNI